MLDVAGIVTTCYDRKNRGQVGEAVFLGTPSENEISPSQTVPGKGGFSPIPRLHSAIPPAIGHCNCAIPVCRFSPISPQNSKIRQKSPYPENHWLRFRETWLPAQEKGVIRGHYEPGLDTPHGCEYI